MEWQEVVALASEVAGENICAKERGGICQKTKIDVTMGQYTGKMAKKAQAVNGFRKPGWGNVYNYGNMHDDFLAGAFPSEQCDVYYDYVEDLEEELNY